MIYDDVVHVDGVVGGRICRRCRRQNVVYFKVHLDMLRCKGWYIQQYNNTKQIIAICL